MKATIGVYSNQQGAIAAVTALKNAGYNAKQLSIIGQTPHTDEGESGEGAGVDSDEVFNRPARVAATGMGIGAVVGPVLGVLTGLGVLAIPGLGLLVGAGAVAGAITGLEVGVVGGGLISALAIARMNTHHETLYQEHLKEGKFLVVAQGDDAQIEQAKTILHQHDQHLHLDTHA